MSRPYVQRLGWLASVVMLTGIVLVAAQTAIPTPSPGDSESSIGERISALVMCVLPATADDPSAPSAGVSETTFPECEPSAPDPVRTVWMTAC